MSQEVIKIYTDGSCQGNPGPGGWAALLMFNGKEKMITGSAVDTTNNRMELQAALSALMALKGSRRAEIWTDSQYVRLGITQWVKGWRKNGWKNSQKKPVKNKDLWEALLQESERHQVKWHWVKGHSGDQYNERVDEAAKAAIGGDV